jgi:hypothetical protein
MDRAHGNGSTNRGIVSAGEIAEMAQAGVHQPAVTHKRSVRLCAEFVGRMLVVSGQCVSCSAWFARAPDGEESPDRIR